VNQQNIRGASATDQLLSGLIGCSSASRVALARVAGN
jgi:hypothetical protein